MLVPIGFGDRGERDLAYLRAAPHDDDALAVDFLRTMGSPLGASVATPKSFRAAGAHRT